VVNVVQHGHRAESPLLSESSLIIESMSKACKYSPEEKKERIERYRSKRNQRNFNKKIKVLIRLYIYIYIYTKTNLFYSRNDIIIIFYFNNEKFIIFCFPRIFYIYFIYLSFYT
jgi:hypothetical protein